MANLTDVRIGFGYMVGGREITLHCEWLSGRVEVSSNGSERRDVPVIQRLQRKAADQRPAALHQMKSLFLEHLHVHLWRQLFHHIG